MRAYNDWMIDEWCAAVPGRLIPMIILPLWDASLALAEVERCAAKGARAVTFSENPAALGLPSVHDRTTVLGSGLRRVRRRRTCPSARTSGRRPSCPTRATTRRRSSWRRCRRTSPRPPSPTGCTAGCSSAIRTLKLCLSEGGIGWIPAILERADYVFDRYAPRLKTGTGFGLTGMGSVDAGEFNRGSVDVRPSELFREHVFGCFIDDRHGAASIEEIGVGNVMVECDYPHGDSSWPHTRELMLEQVAHLSTEDRDRVLTGNARRVFGLGGGDG